MTTIIDPTNLKKVLILSELLDLPPEEIINLALDHILETFKESASLNESCSIPYTLPSYSWNT